MMDRGQRTEDRGQYLVTRGEGRRTRDVRHPSSIVLRSLSIISVSLCLMLLWEALYAASPVAKDISSKVIKDTQNSTLNSLKLQASDADAGDVLTYTLSSLPNHGQLKEEATGQDVITAPYVLSSNKLKYIPETGFIGQDSFTYKANDASADSNTATVSLNIVEWFPPIGILEPEFGIKETYRMYDDPAKRNPALTYNQNTEGGYYTHYIDNTHPAATDTSNPYGTASRPRRAVPINLVAGSVVEVHGGPYTGNNIGVTSIATAAMPTFIRGVGTPEFDKWVGVIGSYVIFEGFYLYASGLRASDPNTHHISLRNCEVEGNGTTLGEAGIGGWEYLSYIVIYNNHIHHHGDYAYVGENDHPGVTFGSYNHHLWVMDNHIHHNGGDSFQAGHRADRTTTHIYIGRDIMHDDGENAIDLKDCTDIIVSENIMYNYPGPDGIGSVGTIIVTHYGPSPNYRGTVRAWFLFNEMYNAKQSANQVSSGPEDIYFIGNVIHDIDGAAFLGWQHKTTSYIGNTIYNVSSGISDDISAGYQATIANNIFGRLTPAGGAHIDVTGSVTASNNLFQEPMNSNKVCVDCIEADPLFVNAVNNDFSLLPASPAIDAGTSSGVVQQAFDSFEQLYGIDIRKDIEGKTRPQGSAWDIGAYEYTSDSGTILYGDVSGDSEISAYDAALTAQASVAIITLTAEQSQKADVNGDAEVSAYDAALIAQYAVGLISKFPAEN